MDDFNRLSKLDINGNFKPILYDVLYFPYADGLHHFDMKDSNDFENISNSLCRTLRSGGQSTCNIQGIPYSSEIEDVDCGGLNE